MKKLLQNQMFYNSFLKHFVISEISDQKFRYEFFISFYDQCL